MAADDQRAEKYIVDLPYSVLLSIYQSLDADKGWEKLAGETGYTFDKIRLLELEYGRPQGSPSRSLLWELGSRNTTLRQLYGYLSAISRYREMKILEDYVNSPVTQSSHDNGLKGLKAKSMDSSDPPSCCKGHMNSCGASESKKNNTSLDSDSYNFNSQSSSDMNNSMKYFPKDKQYSGKQIPAAAPSSPPPVSPTKPPSVKSGSGSIQTPLMKPSNPSRVVPPSHAAQMVKQMVDQMSDEQGAVGGVGVGAGLGGAVGLGLGGRNVPGSGTSASSCVSPLPGSSTSISQMSMTSSGPSSLPGLDSSLDLQMGLMGSACFKFSDIERATNGFDESKKIGEGAFGVVYSATLKHMKCAVKKLANADNTIAERSTQVKRELTSLLKFRHENIVTLYGYALEGESLCLVYQFMPNGSLEDRIICKNGSPPLVWSQRLNILLGACQGLNFLHNVGEQPLIHGDIKSANILLDKHMEAKIGDLGQAQQATSSENSGMTRHTHITKAQTTSKQYGTRAYQAPELQQGGQASTKSDVYSMGVVILELFSGEKAFDERREGEKFLGACFYNLEAEQSEGVAACLARIDKRGGDCPHEVAESLLSIAKECRERMKKKRPTAAQLLEKVVATEKLYQEKTGMKSTGLESMPGSECSCYESHSSSAAPRSIGNMGAPPPCDLHRPASQNAAIYNVNINKDSPTHKHYATQLHHTVDEPPKDNRLAAKADASKRDNRLAANMASPVSPPGASRQSSQCSNSSGPSSLGSISNPMEVLQAGSQPLPAAFRLQKAYDDQNISAAEKRRIERLSQCYPPGESSRTQTEVLPPSDPAKLAQLEQFDRMNLDEKEPNTFESDPKKLAALKQFDGQGTFPTVQKLFDDDNSNVGPESIIQQSQREESLLAPDPKKMAALKKFDDANSSANSHSQLRHAEGTTGFGNVGQLVSQEDYLLSTQLIRSQEEALRTCNSMRQQQLPEQNQQEQDEVFVRQSPSQTRRTPSLGEQRTSDSSYNTSKDENDDCDISEDATQLLRKRDNLFEMYQQMALECGDDVDAADGESVECFEEDRNEEESYRQNNSGCNDSSVREWASAAQYNSPPTQEMVSMHSIVNGEQRPVPSEQDEAILNHFKARDQHYEKTFNRPSKAC